MGAFFILVHGTLAGHFQIIRTHCARSSLLIPTLIFTGVLQLFCGCDQYGLVSNFGIKCPMSVP